MDGCGVYNNESQKRILGGYSMDQMKIIEQLKEDKEFLAKLGAVKDEAEAQAVFASKGIQVSQEELKAILNGDSSEELGEDQLEAVAGGMGIAMGIAALCFLAGLAKGLKCK